MNVANERSVVFALENNFLFVVVDIESLVFDFGRIREVVDNAVEELLNADVLVSGAHEDRGEFEGNRLFADGLLEEILVDFIHAVLAFHSKFHDCVVVICAAVNELFTVFLSLILEFVRDVGDTDVVAVSAFEVVCLHFDKVDHALELVFEADGDLHNDRLVIELFLEHHSHAERVCAGTVALVDEHDARDVIALHLTVNSDGLRLDAFHAGQNEDCTVQHAEGAFHFNREVHVPRGIDDVDSVLFAGNRVSPVSEGGCRLNRDAAFAFEFHGVHRSADAVFTTNFVDCVNTLCEIEDTFGEGSLTRVNVGRDTDVSMVLDIFHFCFREKFDKTGAQNRKILGLAQGFI